MPIFRHGVASGDPLSDAVVLWTRATVEGGEPLEVDWRLARDPGLEDVVADGTALAEPERDWTVHVDARGLEPATRYWYGFEARGERSETGRTRTLPAGSPERVRIAFTSCAKYTAGWFNVYARLAELDDLDLVLHLGDYIYEYGNDDGKAPAGEIGRAADPPHECRTLDDYRRRYRCHRLDEDVRALHATHPLVCIVDDHEICDDTWRGGAEKHEPERDGPWEERRAAALRAWREWLPHRLPGGERIYRELALGDLADLLLLDGRSYRDRPAKPPERDDRDRTLLGAEQLAWLGERLEASDAAWRLVGNSVMIGQAYTELLPEELGEPLSELGVLTKDDEGPDPDQWDGYPAERLRVFDLVERSRDVVFLSGDVHTSWANELKRDPTNADETPLAVELVTPSITSENLDEERKRISEHEADVEVEQHVRDLNPHVRWLDLDRHGFVLLDVDRERLRAEWWFVDRLDRRSDGLELGACFDVRRGEPLLVAT